MDWIDHDTIVGCSAGVYLPGAGVGQIELIMIFL